MKYPKSDKKPGVMVGPPSPSKEYRKAGDYSYGSSANVRESDAKSWDKPKRGKAKEGSYARYS